MSQCFVCGSIMSLEEHHLRLQAQGGTTGRTVMLDSNCHDACHKVARALQSVHSKTRAKAWSYIPVNLHVRASLVVEAILAGGLTYETERDLYQDHANLNLQIPISARQRQRLHMLKQRQGFTNLEDFLMAIVAKMTGVRAYNKEEAPNDSPPTMPR